MAQGLRNDQVALYKKDMYKAEREGYMEVPTTYNRVFMVKNSVKGAGDKVSQILGAGPLTRHTVEGQDVDFKAPVDGWEFLVKYHTYSAGLSLSKEAVEDTVKLGNLLNDLATTWGKQNRIAKETMAATVFNNGGDLAGEWVFNGTHTGNTDSSGDLLYDSKPLFALSGNNHTTITGSGYYNSVAAAGAISATNFETLYNLHTVTNAYDERDERIENPVDALICKCGADHFKARRIFETTKEMGIPGSANNDINPYYGIIKEIIPWRYITETSDVFYIGKARSTDFQFHERQTPELRFFRDETNLGYKVSNNLRIGVLIKNWRTWTRGGGSSS